MRLGEFYLYRIVLAFVFIVVISVFRIYDRFDKMYAMRLLSVSIILGFTVDNSFIYIVPLIDL